MSLITCGGEAPRMEMLDGSKDFRVQILWVVSALNQREATLAILKEMIAKRDAAANAK